MKNITGRPGSLRILAAILAFAAAATGGCGGQPQISGDRESLAAADALWTAVTARRSELVEQCATEVRRLHERAQMPDDAFESLEGVIAEAQAGHWDNARGALKAFLRGQRPAPRG